MRFQYQSVSIFCWRARFWLQFRITLRFRRGAWDFPRCSGRSNTWVVVPKWAFDDSKPILSRSKLLLPELAHHWKKYCRNSSSDHSGVWMSNNPFSDGFSVSDLFNIVYELALYRFTASSDDTLSSIYRQTWNSDVTYILLGRSSFVESRFTCCGLKSFSHKLDFVGH